MISKFQIKFIKSLHLKKFRTEHHQFIAEGEKNVQELLESNLSVNFVFALPDWINKNKTSVKKPTELVEINEKELQQISTQVNPNKVLAVAQIPDYPLNFFSEHTVIALDDIQDPGNLGTIIRIADWYGIDTIICSEESVDLFNPKVINATMGSFCRVKVHYTDLKRYIRHSGKKVYGAVLDGLDIYHTLFEPNCILLFGNESHGINDELRKMIDYPITIPRVGQAESLNIAVSTGIVCDNFLGRRN